MTNLVETSLHNDLARFFSWLQANKVSINAVKTKFMITASPTSLLKLVEKPNIQILQLLKRLSKLKALTTLELHKIKN